MIVRAVRYNSNAKMGLVSNDRVRGSLTSRMEKADIRYGTHFRSTVYATQTNLHFNSSKKDMPILHVWLPCLFLPVEILCRDSVYLNLVVHASSFIRSLTLEENQYEALKKEKGLSSTVPWNGSRHAPRHFPGIDYQTKIAHN